MPISKHEKFKEFDKSKRVIGRRWSKISVYDVRGQETLLFEGFKCYIYSITQLHLDRDELLQKFFSKVNNFVKSLIIPEKSKENKVKEPLEEFLENEPDIYTDKDLWMKYND